MNKGIHSMKDKFGHYYFILLLIITGLIGCGNSQSQDFKEIKPLEVKRFIDQQKDIIIIDVRTAEEYIGPLGLIRGTLLRPIQEIEKWIDEFEAHKGKEIIMVCRSGNRSGVAAEYFAQNGFNSVYNMIGGMRAWNAAGFPVEKSVPKDQEND